MALWWIWLPLLLIWIFYANNKSSDPNKAGQGLSSQDPAKDVQWHNYILSFKDVVRTKAEKNLIDTLLTRKTADQLYANREAAEAPEAQPQSVEQLTETTHVLPVAAQTKQHTRSYSQPLDNTLLLLYFGAFLLVASAGLFVAIGKFDGLIRAITAAITAITLYLGGLWLYKTKKKLAQAGISFIGTGMIIAPLSGVAWYNLVSNQTNGAVIWLVTSVACLGLYMHALSVVNNSFVAYLLIGSFVSSIESAVLAIALPSYVFAWVMIVVSLILQFMGLWRGQSKKLLEASDTSAQLLVPLSIVGSGLLLPNFGSRQLAITLLLAAGYYALLAWQRPNERLNYSTAAQLSTITAIANITYSVRESFWVVGMCLGILSIVYAVIIIAAKIATIKEHNLVAVGAAVSSAGIILSISNAWSLVACISIGLALAATVWLKLQSKKALSIGGVLLLGLPFVAGQYALNPHASASLQLVLCSLPVVILGAITIYTCKKTNFRNYYDISSVLYVFSALLWLFTAWVTGFATLLIVCIVLALGFASLHYISKKSEWWLFSGSTVLVPIAYSVLMYGTDDKLFSLAVGLALAANIAISLKTRERAIRWILVGCILISPIAVGGGGLGIHWQEAGYGGGYLLAMAGCVLARAIARGKLLVSSKVPVSSYDEKASQAYVIGYISAAAIATFVSLFDVNSRLVTTLVLGLISVTLLYVVYYRIESNSQALAILPLLLQAMLFSGLRPDLANPFIVGVAALFSSSLALVMYASIITFSDTSKNINKLLLSVSIITSYFGPALVLFGSGSSNLLPVSLAIAGGLTTYHNRTTTQNTRELSIGVIIASAHWFLYLNGVHNVHIHTHLLALFLGGFAVWRNRLGDRKGSSGYVQALFLIATVPMVLQALGGQSGKSYGLILIVQQVGFMLAGVLLNQRFLLKAGMWVALGAILYQLRGLGWAFLTLVAAIIIGVAIYRLQKHEDTQPKN